MIRHNGPVSGVASSENFVATAGYDNQVILWNRQTKTAVARGLHDHLANRCEISKDEKFLLSASSDYTARIWALPDMKLVKVFSDHDDDVETARFSPCQTMVATASIDGRVRIFSIDGHLLHRLEGHVGMASACAWSNNGETLVSSGDDGTIRTWDVGSGRQIGIVQPENVQTDSIAMTAGGLIFAGNDAGELVRIIDGSLERLAIHGAGIKNVAVSPDGQRVATLSYDRDLALVSARGPLRVVKKIKIPDVVWARACVFQDDENLLFGTFGSSYATFNLKNEAWDFSRLEDTDCINAIYALDGAVYTVGDAGVVRKVTQGFQAARPTEKIAEMGSLCNFLTRYRERLVCGGHLGKVMDARTGEVLLTLNSPINKAIQVGECLVLATYVGELAVVRERADRSFELVGEYKVLSNAIKDLCADGNLVFCGGAACDLAIFDLASLRKVAGRENAHGHIINSCTALGAGTYATVSRDLKLNIWRGVELDESVTTPHDHSIKCAAASADKRFVATCSYDGKIAIYDREARAWPVVKKLTSAGISSVIFADGAFLAASYDGFVYRTEMT